MNILFISNYKNFGGWSDAACSHMRELVHLNHDVNARHINIGQGYREIPLIDQLQKPLSEPDVIIQHTLPSLTHIDRRAKNIIVYYSETDRIPSTWVQKINSFDAAIVSCSSMEEAAKNSGVNIPIYKNPITVSHNNQPTVNIRKNPYSCVFYTIGDCNTRKNLPALLTAFHSEFSSSESVELVIKLSESQDQIGSKIDRLSKEIKGGLRRYGENHYVQETYLCGYSNDLQVDALHNSADIFVSTSFGEAFCIPAIQAALAGNLCVVPNHTAFKDYFTKYLVDCSKTPCFGAIAPPQLQTSDENWWSIHIDHLRKTMREAYNDWKKGSRQQFKSPSSKWKEIIEQVSNL